MKRPRLGKLRESIRVVRSVIAPAGTSGAEATVEVIMLAKADVRQIKPEAQEGGGSDALPNSPHYQFTARVPTRQGRLPVESKQIIQWRGASYRIQEVTSDFYLGFVKILATLDESVLNEPPTVTILFGLDRLGTVAQNGSGQCWTLARQPQFA